MVDCCCCDPPPPRRCDRCSIRPVAVPVVVPGDHHQMGGVTTKEGHINYDVSFIGGVCGCQRVATTRRFISLNIDALTSAASSARQMRDASIITCPMSPSKRALLPQREVAVTVGYWRTHDDAKNSRFFCGSAQRCKHDTHPADARAGTGPVGRGRGKGGESCWHG